MNNSDVRTIVADYLSRVDLAPCADNSCIFGKPGGISTPPLVAVRLLDRREDLLDRWVSLADLRPEAQAAHVVTFPAL